MITFSDITTADAVFYQSNDFVGYPHVQGLYPIGIYSDKWTEKRLLFFVTSFKRAAELHGFDYAYKFTREIAASIEVKLSVTLSGEPDWDYMDKYMSDICDAEGCIEKLLQADGAKHNLDIANWKKFHLYDDGLFIIDMGTKLDRVKMAISNPEVNFSMAYS